MKHFVFLALIVGALWYGIARAEAPTELINTQSLGGPPANVLPIPSPQPETQTLDGGEKGGSWRITAHGAVPIDTPPAAAATLPHLFLPAVAVYKDKRFLGLVVGKTIHLSCRDALDATQSAIAKHFEAVDGSTAIGLCIPVQAFSVADLIPPELAKPGDKVKPADDNTV